MWNGKLNRKRKKQLSGQMNLMITPMADIFTLLLVFLLKSFSTGVSSVTPSGNIVLPESSFSQPTVEGLKLEISPRSVMLEDKVILEVNELDFQGADVDSRFEGLFTILQRARRKNAAGVAESGVLKMLVLADRKTPFALLRRVLAASTLAGFIDYKLLVVGEQ